MRAIVLFDLPTLTTKDRKDYTAFRKFLIKEGFIMMQQSVYTKILLNSTGMKLIKNKLNKNKPSKGLVQILIITEKQFNSMDYIVGESTNNVEDSINRMIIL